ncbi:MAG: cation transporter [Bdellovibrionales bacterium]|nr:cation transporter [Bdellovibrionales bacterium]
MANTSQSSLAIISAILGNLAIAISKFTASFFTSSAAMFAEGIHSLVDTGNGILLLVGIRKSQRPPDHEHPFGYGKEIYFWTLVVSILIFALGGGISIYEGLIHLFTPRPLGDPFWNYIVLAIAFAFEFSVLIIALKEFNRFRKPGQSIFQAIKQSKDPSLFTVLFEDAAATVGIVIAFLGVWMGQLFQNLYMDGLASLLIGIILCLVAFFLAVETKSLLIGESADPDMVAKIRDILEKIPYSAGASNILTMHFGPQYILVNVDLRFREGTTADQMIACIDQVERQLLKEFPQVKKVFVEADSLVSV